MLASRLEIVYAIVILSFAILIIGIVMGKGIGLGPKQARDGKDLLLGHSLESKDIRVLWAALAILGTNDPPCMPSMADGRWELPRHRE